MAKALNLNIMGVETLPPAPNEICDARNCPAHAVVAADFLWGRLTFCGHHADSLALGLRLKAIGITDTRSL